MSSFVSRDELLGGLPAKRASTLLFAIESRTAHLALQARQVGARYLTEQSAIEQERAFLGALAQGREANTLVKIQELERYAPQWAPLVPVQELKIWAHTVTPEGNSEPLPLQAHIIAGPQTQTIDLQAQAGQVIVSVNGAPIQVRLDAQSNRPK